MKIGGGFGVVGLTIEIGDLRDSMARGFVMIVSTRGRGTTSVLGEDFLGAEVTEDLDLVILGSASACCLVMTLCFADIDWGDGTGGVISLGIESV